MSPEENLQKVAREWMAARDVIVQALRELLPMTQPLDRDQVIAAAILARLAAHQPPITLSMEASNDA